MYKSKNIQKYRRREKTLSYSISGPLGYFASMNISEYSVTPVLGERYHIQICKFVLYNLYMHEKCLCL